jgi:hypothetical protein
LVFGEKINLVENVAKTKKEKESVYLDMSSFMEVARTKRDPLKNRIKQGVCQTVALPFTLKRILMQKKNYENSNISPCKNVPNLPKIL